MKITQKILLFGLFLTPFTSLRFGFVGLGEILIAISCVFNLTAAHSRILIDARIRMIYVFWFVFLSASLLGLFYNAIFLGFSSGSPDTAAFDFLAYLYILFFIFQIGHLARSGRINVAHFFKRLFELWAVFYILLYGLSFFTSSIFGLPLRYHAYFSPLVDNLHQAASITCSMGFIMLYLFAQSRSLVAKLFYMISAVLFAKMALDSGSTKAFLGVWAGAVSSLTFLVLYRSSDRNTKVFSVFTLILFVSITFFYLTFNYEMVRNTAIRFFQENDVGNARGTLYTVGFGHGLKSFLFGYGPGPQCPFGGKFWDAHNTSLTIFLQGGLLGILAFVPMVTKLARNITVHFALTGALTAIGMYALGGDILRRLPIWIMIVGLAYFADQTRLTRVRHSDMSQKLTRGHGHHRGKAPLPQRARARSGHP